MAAEACGYEYTDETKEALDEAEKGYDSKYTEQIWGPVLEETMPEVEKAIEERCVECLQENVENAKNELIERLDQEGREFTDLERLDLEVEPTEKEYREMYEVGKELRMTRDLEIIDMPAITGIKDIETKVEIHDKELEAMGIRGIKDIPHIDTETMKSLMRETLGFLKDSKIPYDWRDQRTVNMIVFVDKQEPGSQPGKIAVERVVKPEMLQKTDRKTLERSINLYIFQNKEGRLVPRDPKDAKNEEEKKEFEKERREFQWKTAHGISHINDAREGRFDEKIIDSDHQSEWIRAVKAQLKTGVVDKEPGKREVPYSLSDIPPEYRNDPEIVQGGREFRAQHFAAWVTDSSWAPGSPPLCPEMKEFFDRYFKE